MYFVIKTIKKENRIKKVEIAVINYNNTQHNNLGLQNPKLK